MYAPAPARACVALALFALAAALDDDDYKPWKTFHGDATYYGATEGGNCAIRKPRPAFYNAYVPVAINDAQYEGMCGACLLVTGKGKGLGGSPVVGTFQAWVMDRCPECKHGDIDLSKSGDGRWEVSWRVIPCRGARKISFQFEGSNAHYLKFQPRGMRSPAKQVKVNGVKCSRTQDNHWLVMSGAGFKPPFHIEVKTYLGGTTHSYINSWHGVQYGGNIGGGGWAPPKKVWTPPKKVWRPKRPWVAPAKCVPKWKPCSGPRNWWRTSRCCGGFVCRWPADKSFGSKRCEQRWTPPKKRWTPPKKRWTPPKRRWAAPGKCVPKWAACSGPRNWWKTSKCCGGFECRWPADKSFGSKRCEQIHPKFVGCRRPYERCGFMGKWRRWNWKPMWGRHCCSQGHGCKWAAGGGFVGFRCQPW